MKTPKTRSLEKIQISSRVIDSASTNSNLKVFIRVRPPLPREKDKNYPFNPITYIESDNQTISLVEYIGNSIDEYTKREELITNPNNYIYHRYKFDYIFDMNSSQKEVYNIAASPSLKSILDGYNSTIIAYGQTGSGKTYTMEGFTFDPKSPNKGLIPRVIEKIFKYLENTKNIKNIDEISDFSVKISYLQIYNESIDDLLKPNNKNLNIREDNKKGLYVELLSEYIVKKPNDLYELLEKGEQNRAKSNTKMNDLSSRSHAIFIINIEQIKITNNKKEYKFSKLNMVDLAGSERIKVSGVTGKQLEESKKINKSLSALGNVINCLTDNKSKHIPYRDSKLTRILENSLCGDCITSMIAMISPYIGNYNESISTLNFAKRAKNIKVTAKMNIKEEINTQNIINDLIMKYKLNNIFGNNEEYITKILMEKKQAINEKNEAVAALEKASISFLKERQEKKLLQEKISILSGAQNTQNTLSTEKNNLNDENEILLQKANEKIIELQNKINSYEDLLIKQNEIMLKLAKELKKKENEISMLTKKIKFFVNKDNINSEISLTKNDSHIYTKKIINKIDSKKIFLPKYMCNEKSFNQKTFRQNKSLKRNTSDAFKRRNNSKCEINIGSGTEFKFTIKRNNLSSEKKYRGNYNTKSNFCSSYEKRKKLMKSDSMERLNKSNTRFLPKKKKIIKISTMDNSNTNNISTINQ